MPKLKDYKNCTGCGACSAACGQGAISMKENSEGFLYPEVNSDLCMECRICEKVCEKTTIIPDAAPNIYAMVHSDKETLLASSSGGAFAALSEYVLSRGGCVCGCIYSKQGGVHHIITDDPGKINLMHGSKYVQSRISESLYKELELKLKAGTLVLFTGTPCQVQGVRVFLKKDYKNLISVDLICHGVPSPKLFNDYISITEKKFGEPIYNVSFRDKSKIKKDIHYYMSFRLKNGVKHRYVWADPYFKAFINCENHRESCYNCPYAGKNRCGDFTIADYWGVENYHNIDYQNGCSLIFANSALAKELTDVIFERHTLIPSNIDNIKLHQAQINRASNRPKCRSDFYKNAYKDGIETWYNSFYKTKAYKKSFILCHISYMLPASLRRKLKKSK